MTPFTEHLIFHALGYFYICEHLCALECDNSNLNDQTSYLNEYYILCL
jgi:hypothetical protein